MQRCNTSPRRPAHARIRASLPSLSRYSHPITHASSNRARHGTRQFVPSRSCASGDGLLPGVVGLSAPRCSILKDPLNADSDRFTSRLWYIPARKYFHTVNATLSLSLSLSLSVCMSGASVTASFVSTGSRQVELRQRRVKRVSSWMLTSRQPPGVTSDERKTERERKGGSEEGRTRERRRDRLFVPVLSLVNHQEVFQG